MDNDYTSTNTTTCLTDLPRVGLCIDLDNMPVTIVKDKITYDFQDYINMLIEDLISKGERTNEQIH